MSALDNITDYKGVSRQTVCTKALLFIIVLFYLCSIKASFVADHRCESESVDKTVNRDLLVKGDRLAISSLSLCTNFHVSICTSLTVYISGADDYKAYRYSEEKTLAWLTKKVLLQINTSLILILILLHFCPPSW